MPIMIAPNNEDLVVKRILGSDKTLKHLRELGIVPNMKILVLSVEPSGIIVRVGESRLALDKDVAKAIQVEIAEA